MGAPGARMEGCLERELDSERGGSEVELWVFWDPISGPMAQSLIKINSHTAKLTQIIVFRAGVHFTDFGTFLPGGVATVR